MLCVGAVCSEDHVCYTQHDQGIYAQAHPHDNSHSNTSHLLAMGANWSSPTKAPSVCTSLDRPSLETFRRTKHCYYTTFHSLKAAEKAHDTLARHRNAKLQEVIQVYETEFTKMGNALVLADTKYLCEKQYSSIVAEYEEPLAKFEQQVDSLQNKAEKLCREMLGMLTRLTEPEKDEWLLKEDEGVLVEEGVASSSVATEGSSSGRFGWLW